MREMGKLNTHSSIYEKSNVNYLYMFRLRELLISYHYFIILHPKIIFANEFNIQLIVFL